MKTTTSIPGAIALVVFTGLIYLSLALLSPPAVVPETAAPEVFSAVRAAKHLPVIANAPHSGGTVEHKKVRDYLVEQCKAAGLLVDIQDATGIQVRGDLVNAGRAVNILARLKGEGAEKTILVLSHYDSQPHTPGAADDGAGIAAMLESIRALKSGKKLSHDVLFVMTDLEEIGLLGAEAFVSQKLNAEEIGILLNYEARGNRGVSFTFEVSDQNGWLMQEFSKATKYPFANSLAYEVYKLMPNSSDFTMFKSTGISGLNSAFIEGFVNYHSMTDSPENIDLRSVQHHGTNMLGLIRHFDQLDLSQTKASDAIFFNLFGSWLILYPISWDWPLILLTTLLFIGVIAYGFSQKRLFVRDFFWGIWYFIDVLGLSLLLVFLCHVLMPVLYPHYANFYSSNFYNAPDYLYAFTGFVIISFSLFFGGPSSKRNHGSMALGIMLVLIVLMYVTKTFVQTGAYIFYVPIAWFLLMHVIFFTFFPKTHKQNSGEVVIQCLAAFPLISIWVPFLYTLFIVFSWDIPYAPVVLMVLMSPFFIQAARFIPKKWLYTTGTLLIVFGLGKAHLYSGSSAEQPLQSNLVYAHNLDTQEAHWLSIQKNLDDWNKQYFTSGKKGDFTFFFGQRELWKEASREIKSTISTVQVFSDTTINDIRTVQFKLLPSEETNSVEIRFPTGAKMISVEGRNVAETQGRYPTLRYTAPPKRGITFSGQFPQGGPIQLKIVDRKLGLPKSLLTFPMPTHIIPAPNYFSHIRLIEKTIAF